MLSNEVFHRNMFFRIWNYNKAGSEDLMRGCKEALLSLDGRPLKKFLLRMGVGCPVILFVAGFSIYSCN